VVSWLPLRLLGKQQVSVHLWNWCSARTEENKFCNGEVHAVVLSRQSRYILRGASPQNDVAFHIIGTIVQQASQSRCMRNVGATAKRAGCSSQRVSEVYATAPVSVSQRLSARW
jgi:hypothetical protein